MEVAIDQIVGDKPEMGDQTEKMFTAPVYNPLLPAPLRQCGIALQSKHFSGLKELQLCDVAIVGTADPQTVWVLANNTLKLCFAKSACGAWNDVTSLKRNCSSKVLACTPKSKCIRLIDNRSRRVILRVRVPDPVYMGAVFSKIQSGCLTYLSSTLDAVSLDVNARRIDSKRNCRSQIEEFLKTEIAVASIQMVKFEGIASKASEEQEILVLWGLCTGRSLIAVFRKSLMSFQLVLFEMIDNFTKHVEHVEILTQVSEDPILMVFGTQETLIFKVRSLPHDDRSEGSLATLDCILKAAL